MADRVIVMTERPGSIKNIYNIELTNKSTPIENRKAKEFAYYYELIWKILIFMYSQEHKRYLRKIKINNFLIRLTQLLIIAFLLILWQLLADFKVINTFISSSPKDVIKTLITLHNTHNLYQHIAITIYETIISFTLGNMIGVVIATILWWNKFIAKVIDPYLTILNSLPKVALGPIIIIWAGANMKSIILMALLISVIVTIINIYQGFASTDPNKIKLMQAFQANKNKSILNYYYQVVFQILLVP